MMATLGELSVTISLYQIIIDRPTNQLTDGHEIAFNHVFNQPGGESCIAAKKRISVILFGGFSPVGGYSNFGLSITVWICFAEKMSFCWNTEFDFALEVQVH